MNFTYNMPTKIIFGCGKIGVLSQLIDKEINRILIVTDKIAFEKSGAQSAVLNQLNKKQIELFDEVEENPSFSTIRKGLKIVKEHKIQLIIGIGGGSPLDVAKGIAAFATNNENFKDYIEGRVLSQDPLHVICIPTTSGTGSEVTPYAVFTDHDKKEKVCLSNSKIFPIRSSMAVTL